jgi:ribosome-binding factor A
MANPKRVKMVAKQIMREISDMLITDNVLQFAVLPEASLGADSYLSSLTTITDVEITGDLQVSLFLLIASLSFAHNNRSSMLEPELNLFTILSHCRFIFLFKYN